MMYLWYKDRGLRSPENNTPPTQQDIHEADAIIIDNVIQKNRFGGVGQMVTDGHIRDLRVMDLEGQQVFFQVCRNQALLCPSGCNVELTFHTGRYGGISCKICSRSFNARGLATQAYARGLTQGKLVWRGSVGDLATDIRGLLTPEQLEELCRRLA